MISLSIDYQQLIGRGASAYIYKATLNGQECVAKICPRSEKNHADMLRNEVNILMKLTSPCTIMSHYYFEDLVNAYIFLQYCPYGSIGDLLDKGTKFTERECRAIFGQLIMSLSEAHEKNICHHDIKPENILVRKIETLKSSGVENEDSLEGSIDEKEKFYSVCLADWGLSSQSQYKVMFKRGTPLFFAPEIYFGQPYDAKKIDVWALGATLYNIITGSVPFPAETTGELQNKLLSKEPQYPPPISFPLRKIFEKMFLKNADVRCSIKDLLEDEYFEP